MPRVRRTRPPTPAPRQAASADPMRNRSLWISLIGIVAVAAVALIATFAIGNSPALGLDLQGGASVGLQPKSKVDSGTLDTAIQIIRNRVDGLGVAEPEIVRQGTAVVVNLPGVKDQDRALQVVGQTAELRFRPVLAQLPPESSTTSTTAAGATTTVAGATTVPTATTAAGATTLPTATTVAGATTVPTATTAPTATT